MRTESERRLTDRRPRLWILLGLGAVTLFIVGAAKSDPPRASAPILLTSADGTTETLIGPGAIIMSRNGETRAALVLDKGGAGFVLNGADGTTIRITTTKVGPGITLKGTPGIGELHVSVLRTGPAVTFSDAKERPRMQLIEKGLMFRNAAGKPTKAVMAQ
jgi:hypothetical protein